MAQRNERVKRTIIPCATCGKDIRFTPRDLRKARNNIRHYCSRECAQIGYKKNAGEIFAKNRKIFVCLNCGKEQQVIKSNKQMFCSKKCVGEYKRKRVNIRCDYCDKEIERTPAFINKTNFCSKKCQNKYHSKRMRGRGNPRWEGGITEDEYPFEWNKSLRKKIRDRDNWTCVKCNTKKVGNNIQLDVHHINKDKNNCSEDNLITLCHTCHMSYHGQTQGKLYLKYTPKEWETDFFNWLSPHYAEVIDIQENKQKEKVYNLEIKDNNNYLVNNHLTHNCIVDESSELSSDVWTKIGRMLLENQTAKIVEIYNPWFLNHTFDHSQDPDWYSVKIDVNDCIKEGRFTQEQVDMTRQEISNPLDQRVLLDAEFPDTADNSLFTYSDILKATRDIDLPKMIPEIRLSVDIARKGRDDTIAYLIYRYGGLFVVKNEWKLDKQRLTKSAGDIIELVKANNVKVLQIDGTGIGAGLDDMLQEYIDNSDIDLVFNSLVFSEKAHDVYNLNRKADIYMNLAELFRKGNIIIPNDSVLVRQLRNIQYEVMSNGKKKVLDNQEKSPDKAESLGIGCYYVEPKQMLIGNRWI